MFGLPSPDEKNFRKWKFQKWTEVANILKKRDEQLDSLALDFIQKGGTPE